MNKKLLIILALILVLATCLSSVACNGGKTPVESTVGTTAESTRSDDTEDTTESSSQSETTGTGTGTETGSKIPEADSTLTVEEAVALGKYIGHNNYTENKYFVVGTVDTVYNATSGNMVISDDKGNSINIVSAYNEDGTVKYGDMAQKPMAGDTVTVYGCIGLYNGSARIKNAWITAFNTPSTDTTGTGEGTQTTETSNGSETTEAIGSGQTTENTTDGQTTEAPVVTEEPETVIDDGIVYPNDPDIETEGKKDDDVSGGESNACHGRYAYDAGYHWSPACNVIGQGHDEPRDAGPKKLHELYCTIEDEGDVVVYTYTCIRCKYTTCNMEVPYDAAMYLDPTTIMGSSHNFGRDAATLVSTDGLAATRFISLEGAGDYVTVYKENANTLATGKYMIVKVKLGNGRSGFKLGISSTKAYSENSSGDPCVYATVGGLSPGWSTAIIDVSKLVDGSRGYTPSNNGEYYVCEASLYVDGIAKEGYFDIGYVAFCETLEDAIAFTENDGAVYVYSDLTMSPRPSQTLGTVCNHEYTKDADTHTSQACSVCLDEGGTVPHSYLILIEKNEDGKVVKYGGSCICGRAAPDKVISEDINYFSMPGQLYNRWNTGGLVKTYVRTGLVMSDGEQIFTRVSLQSGASLAVSNDTATYNGDNTSFEISGGAGRYVVFRLRTSGTDSVAIWVDDSKTAGWKDNQCVSRTGDDVRDDQWYTYVVDMKELGYKFYDCEDKNTKKIKVGFKFSLSGNCENEGGLENHLGCSHHYADLAYFAICDDWAEVEKVAGSETLYYTLWTGATPIIEVNTEGKCVSQHLPRLASDGSLVYTCSICKNTLDTITVDSSINYFSAPGQMVNNWACSSVPSEGGSCDNQYTDHQGNLVNLTDLRYDEDNGVYTRVHLYNGASFFAANGTVTPGNHNRDDKKVDGEGITDKLATGQGCGKYAVFKIRSINNTAVRFMITTNTGKNFGWVNRESTTDLLSEEFHTYVVDIGIADPNATAVRIFLGGYTGEAQRGACIDFAYFAIVDNWDEIALVAADEDVVYVTQWAGGAALVERDPTGGETCAVHTPTFESFSNGVYTYNCAVCPATAVKTITVPTGTNYYSAPGQYYNQWSTGTQNNGSFSPNTLLYIDEEGGFVYNHIKLFQGGSFEITNGSVTPKKNFESCDDKIDGGSGSYIVMKIRIPESVSLLNLKMADGIKATGSWGAEKRGDLANGGTSTLEADGKWRVYVIDLAELHSSAYGAGDSNVTNVTFGFQGEAGDGQCDGTEYIDIAYFAVCDDWDEIEAVVGVGEKVLYTNWSHNTHDKICYSDGTEITE